MEIVDFPAEFVQDVAQSSFYHQARVARSRAIFQPVGEVQDLGPIWRASVTVTQTGQRRWAFEAWLRSLRGGEVKVRLWDFDYQNAGPIGHGQGHGAYTGQVAHGVSYTTGATWITGAAIWQYDGTLRLGEALAPGQTSVQVRGGTPGVAVIAAGDTISVGGLVAYADAVTLPDAAGRLWVTLGASHNLTGAKDDPVSVGDPLSVVMDWINPEAADNLTGVDRRAAYALDFVEAL